LGSIGLKHGTHKIENTIINGGTSDVIRVNDVQLVEGRVYTESEEERGANVVVLGYDAAADLFPDEDPIGKDVECRGDIFTVIGVLDKRPQPFGSGRSTQDNAAYMSLKAFHK